MHDAIEQVKFALLLYFIILLLYFPVNLFVSINIIIYIFTYTVQAYVVCDILSCTYIVVLLADWLSLDMIVARGDSYLVIGRSPHVVVNPHLHGCVHI